MQRESSESCMYTWAMFWGKVHGKKIYRDLKELRLISLLPCSYGKFNDCLEPVSAPSPRMFLV